MTVPSAGNPFPATITWPGPVDKRDARLGPPHFSKRGKNRKLTVHRRAWQLWRISWNNEAMRFSLARTGAFACPPPLTEAKPKLHGTYLAQPVLPAICAKTARPERKIVAIYIRKVREARDARAGRAPVDTQSPSQYTDCTKKRVLIKNWGKVLLVPFWERIFFFSGVSGVLRRWILKPAYTHKEIIEFLVPTQSREVIARIKGEKIYTPQGKPWLSGITSAGS